jgi:transcription antitermination factor NusA-like protein
MPKICSVCRKSDMLCSACNNLLSVGKITKTDIAVSRALEKVAPSIDFFRTFEHRGKIVIIAGKDSGRIIGKGGKTAKALSKILGKDVDVIEEGDEKKMVEKMIRVPALAVNKVYGKEEKLRVRVEKRFRSRALTDPALMSKVLSKPVEIVFE